MKVIIAGSRTIGIEPDGSQSKNYDIIQDAINYTNFWPIYEVVSGTTKGVDKLGEWWAHAEVINVKQFPAEWKTYKNSAGIIRNESMAKYADALVAIWDGKSKGTKDMIDRMIQLHKKPVFIYPV